MDKKTQFCVIQDYLKEFITNIRENDPLPVRAPSYEVSESEIDGQILDIVYHYLSQRDCHPYIRNLVGHRVWSRMRNSNQYNDDIDGPVHNKQPYYDSLKLIKEVAHSANVIIKDILSTLSPSVIDNLPQYLTISHYCIKNTRRKMEDRCIILQDLNILYDMKFQYPHAYYAVFDGHCGSDGVVYAAAHLHQFLIQNPLYSTNVEAALKHAFHICDTSFMKHAKKERLKGGTTAVVALVRENRLVVAWLGDSQALLVRKRKAAHVGEPHTPGRETERKRIYDMGGAVLNIGGTWRVLGQLAVSRAIGDADYKPYISSECDIKSLEISGDEDFLILACDGLWDTLSPEEAVNLVYAYLTQNDGDTDGVGKCLVEAARLAGSEDNITAVVVFLRPVITLMDEEAIRVERGEVTDVEQVIPVSKDSQPNFIKNLFSQPSVCIGEAINVENNFTKYEPPPFMEEPAPDYDIDNMPENDVIPTDEEVDAVLAELDSIPDAPEDNEESSDDGEWTYAKIEPRTDTQTDDILPDTIFTQDKTVPDSIVEPPIEIDLATPTFAKPSSPRSVEGFITSVELNATQESFLTHNQDPEMNLDKIEQNSGPFSVYVSSSPEPASMDEVVQTRAQISSPVPDTVNNEEPIVSEESFNVEIVHAQSTIEVTPASMKDDSTQIIIPDIMTQSFTGELPIFGDPIYTVKSTLPKEPLWELDNDIVDENLSPTTNVADFEIRESDLGVTVQSTKSPELIEYVPSLIEEANQTIDDFINIIEESDHINVMEESVHINVMEESVHINVMEESDPINIIEESDHINVMEESDHINVIEESDQTIADFINNTPHLVPSLGENIEDSSFPTLSPFNPITDNILTENLSTSINLIENDIEAKIDLIPEAIIIPDKNAFSIVTDSKPAKDNSSGIINESNLLDIHDETVAQSANNVAENEENTVSVKNDLQEDKSNTNQVLDSPSKKVTAETQLKKTIIKNAPNISNKAAVKTERPTKKTMPAKEPCKLQPKKEIGIVKKPATARTISSKTTAPRTTSAAFGISKSTTTKLTTTQKLPPKSTTPKLTERSSPATNKPASSTNAEQIKKPATANITAKSKTITKTTDKSPSLAKPTNLATRRLPTNPRPTTTSTARSAAGNTSRSAAFAAPTKDSKNTANKLLSSKTTSSAVLNRTKVPNKVAPSTQKKIPMNKPTTGMKTKSNEKTSLKAKGKEALVSNGSAKTVEKESCVEKIEKEVVINGDP